MNSNNNDEEKPTPWDFRVFELGSKALYIVAAFVLQLLSLAMVGMAIWSVTGEVWAGKPFLTQLLDSAALIVIAFAVFDVAKFLLEEQVLKDRELSRIAEARRSLTMFLTSLLSRSAWRRWYLYFRTKIIPACCLIRALCSRWQYSRSSVLASSNGSRTKLRKLAKSQRIRSRETVRKAPELFPARRKSA